MSLRPCGGRTATFAIATFAALAMTLLTQVSCRQQTPAARGAVLRRGNGPEIESLDPQRVRSDSALNIARDLYEGLMAVGADGAPVAAAARHYSVTADGKTYRFELRDGLRWSNGDALTAADFVAGWRRLVDPATAAPYAAALAPVRGATAITTGHAITATLGVSAPDAHTLLVQLDKPTPYFLGLVAQPATFPWHVERQANEPVSNGAFKLVRWDIGTELVAERNVHYWNNAANKIDRVEYSQIAEPATELRRYRADELDLTYSIPQQQFTWIHAHHGAELHISPQLSVYFYGFNLRRPPFAGNLKLRLALAMVVDRERLARSVTGVGELPAYSFVPVGTHDYTPQQPDYARWTMPARITRAQQLLRESGFDPKNSPIEIRYNSGEVHNKIAVAVAAMWKQYLNIDARLLPEEFKVLLQDVDRGDLTQVFRSSWVGDYNDAYTFLQLFESGFGINQPAYSNPEVDALLAAASNEVDTAVRRTKLEAAERLMLAEQPVIPLYFYVNKHLVKPRVHGWRDNIMNVAYSKDLVIDPRP